MSVEATQRRCPLLAASAEPEGPAREDRAVDPGQGQRVQGLVIQPRLQAFGCGPVSTEREHVGREIAAIDIEAGRAERQQDAPSAAPGIERGVPVFLHERSVVRDLGPVVVDLGPPTRHEPVVPGRRRLVHPPA